MLLQNSDVLPAVKDGLQALRRHDRRSLIDESLLEGFADSLDLDEALRSGRDREHRWDYLLGHAKSGRVIGLEPHPAHNSEVSVVIRKREAALQQLRRHTRPGASVSAWFWVASGKVDFLPHEKAMLTLSQNGIGFLGRRLLPKHLQKLDGAFANPARMRRR